MLITKDNPVGIDEVIQAIQMRLYNKLVAKWGNVDYDSYGRCYRNKKDAGYIAEVYQGNNEYKEVFWDDSLAALSFWGEDARGVIDTNVRKNIHVVFFVNLAKLKPAITGRADEEVRLDVHEVLRKPVKGSLLSGVKTGIENVLSEYSGSYRDERLKAVDMHPIHAFRFDLSVFYSPFKCN